jgi:putative transposase
MTKIKRYFKPGDICFITNVTYNRLPILIENIDLLNEAFQKTSQSSPFKIIANVILPDHFHILIEADESNPSKIIQKIKMSFGVLYRIKMNMKSGRIWQNRFWDHIIRDQNDLNNHINYIHYNPVKHGLISRPCDWQFSSIREYIEDGVYTRDWGAIEPDNLNGEFGE